MGRSSLAVLCMAASLMVTSCNDTANSLDSVFSEIFPQGEPGGAVLIMKGDKVIFDKGYGTATLGGARITGDTFFNIASCSKQFTAVAVLQLAKEGKIKLDLPINRYFPELSNPIWNKVTVSHLLSHTSGVPDARGYLTREQKITGDDNLAVEYMGWLDHLNFEPGTEYEYINPTFTLLGKLIERAYGQEFEAYMSRNVFFPAGMKMIRYYNPYFEDRIPHMAHGYEYEDVSNMPEERTASENSHKEKNWYEYDYGEETFFATRPDGGIYASTHELAKWEKALRNGTVLPSEWLEKAWTKRICVSESQLSDYQRRPGTWYGYGWFLEAETEDAPVRCIYHPGDNGGFKAMVARYPQSDVLVVLLANRADFDRYGIKTKIENILGL